VPARPEAYHPHGAWHTYPESGENAGFRSAYWRDGYDWRKHEARLNEFPQFTTTIDGANVHFLHVRSPEPDALALVVTHDWPGSVVELLDVIGPLTDPRAHGGDPADAFHLVIPSIPGYGFSGPTREAGWTTDRVARAWAELMARLGYARYGAQGGDWGAFVTPELGRVDPDHVVGVHVNAATVGFIPFGPVDPEELATFTDAEKTRLERLNRFLSDMNGYFQIQATRPQTLAYALTDSPVGQLAWIVEKFKEWTDSSAELPEDAVDRDRSGALGQDRVALLLGEAERLLQGRLGFGRPPAAVAMGVPQLRQNLARSGFSSPQTEQATIQRVYGYGVSPIWVSSVAVSQ